MVGGGGCVIFCLLVVFLNSSLCEHAEKSPSVAMIYVYGLYLVSGLVFCFTSRNFG